MRVAFLISLGAALISGSLTAAEADRILYNRDVRPILSDKCFFCHGPDEKTREAGLRLDVAEAAYADNDGVIAIVPGKPEKSELVFRIETDDPDELMPPAKAHKELSKEEMAILKRWIAEGAEYQDHWAFVNPVRPKTGRIRPNDKTRNEIDVLVQRHLKDVGGEASPTADRTTLIRRLALDLTGFPPSYEEVDAFVQDRSRDAYERLVDRYLSSPHFGERLAMKWLDLVRFADTVGYHGDQTINQTPYRDYVIKAFNDNMSYDQFTREQLAGDLLENPTQNQLIASGYNRLLMTTQEGGAQEKEYLAKYATDRVNNLGSVWMGATLGCAECHDHKFDPYTMKDFYSMQAFFADVEEKGVYNHRAGDRPPNIEILADDLVAEVATLKKEIEKLEGSLVIRTAQQKKAYKEWDTEVHSKLTGRIASHDDNWVDDRPLRKGKQNGAWVYHDSEHGKVLTGKESRYQKGDGAVVQHFLSDVTDGHKVQPDDMVFAYVYLDPSDPPETLMLQVHGKNWEHRGYWGADKVPFGPKGTDNPAHLRMGDLPAAGEWVRLEVPLDEIGLKKGQLVNGLAFTQFGGAVWWDAGGFHTSAGDGMNIPKDLVEVIRKTPSKRTGDEQDKIDRLFVDRSPLYDKVRVEMETRQNRVKEIQKKAIKYPVTKATTPRPIRILPRGDWMNESGPEVQPAIPEFLGKLETGDRRATRLDLANWLVDRDNPFTARVLMNNLWAMYFGRALSTVHDDLGNQGAWPDNGELLDWLAVEFMESGWDVRHMVRQMVTSHAYRQSSLASAEAREWDPYNKHLARQGRFRVDAELVRDGALKISGLLVDEVGGDSVRPYQPAGYYRELNFPKRTYKASEGKDQYRRGLYTHWQRTFTHPSLLAFDAPSRENCTANRDRSNTPLQALTLMNDPTYVEAARAFAERIVTEGGSSLEERVNWASRQVLLRDADDRTLKVLSGVYSKHVAEYRGDAAAARELLSVGDRPQAESVDPVEHAAWTSVARVLLNLHETVTRN